MNRRGPGDGNAIPYRCKRRERTNKSLPETAETNEYMKCREQQVRRIYDL